MKSRSNFFCLILFLVFTSCSTKDQNCKVSVTGVQGEHTLAHAMREAYSESEVLRSKIIANDTVWEFRDTILDFLKAQPTDSSDLEGDFQALSHLFFTQRKAIYTSENKKEAFNALVATCVDCHKSRCTGPLKKIKKLEINP
jgi:hypothetical protein